MIDWNQIAQNFGVWGVFFIAVSAFVFYAGRSVHSWVTSTATQSNTIAGLASDQTARVNTLADVRFKQAQEISDLKARLAVIEPLAKRVPKLEEDYKDTLTKLEQALNREIEKDKLIRELTLKVQDLENKVAIYERAETFDSGGDTVPVVGDADVGAGGRDSGTSAGVNIGGDGGGYGSWSGGSGERDRDDG